MGIRFEVVKIEKITEKVLKNRKWKNFFEIGRIVTCH